MSVHILIADDHGIVRVGLALLLKRFKPDAQVEETDNFEGVLRLVDQQRFDLLIVDINMPGGSYQQTIEVVKRKQPHVKVLIFSSVEERLYAVQLLKTGSDGFLHKLASEEEMKLAIEEMLTKGQYLSEEVKNILVSESLNKDKRNQNPLDVLSDRELDIARFLIQGQGLKEIAGKLNLHVTTVSTYKIRIFEKLKVSNVVDLVKRFRLYEIS